MRTRSFTWLMLTMLLTLAGLEVSTAQAGLLPTQVTVTPDSGSFRWTYNVVLQTDSSIRPGDYFTIYDFAGYIPGTNFQPENFNFSAALVGPTPPRVTPEDDPNVFNMTWTYTGPESTVGQFSLGNFMVNSSSPIRGEGFFTAQSYQTVNGKVDRNITNTDIPVPTQVPEPTSLALMGLGLPMAAAYRAWKRRRMLKLA